MMRKDFETLRALVDKIEAATQNEDQAVFTKNFNSLEIPQLITEIVDFLQPLLTGYEACLYWHMFRHSVLIKGVQSVRVSTRGLMSGVVTSSSGQSADLSYSSVQKALTGLEEKKVIQKVGDTNRDGTLYHVFLPEEVKICTEYMAEQLAHETVEVDENREKDFYNIKENRRLLFERDDYKCYYCGKQLTRFSASLDHITPVAEGGNNSYENLITSCLHCNSRKGSKSVSDFLDEMESKKSN